MRATKGGGCEDLGVLGFRGSGVLGFRTPAFFWKGRGDKNEQGVQTKKEECTKTTN